MTHLVHSIVFHDYHCQVLGCGLVIAHINTQTLYLHHIVEYKSLINSYPRLLGYYPFGQEIQTHQPDLRG